MGLRDLNIELEYRTKTSDIVRDFIVPALSESTTYDRAVGFFSSSSLAEVAQGIRRIALRGGKIRLIASPYLSEQDLSAINDGYARRGSIDRELLLERVIALFDKDGPEGIGSDRLNMLANMIAAGVLDLRIAFSETESGIGMYHEKVAILTDEDGDKVAFAGSMNESSQAMRNNYETIDVFKSWDDDEGRVAMKQNAFDAIWEGRAKGVSTYDFPEVKDTIMKKYMRRHLDLRDDLIDEDEGESIPSRGKLEHHFPRIPAEYDLRGYQIEAVENWKKAGFRGIFDMATGTGKTVTALAAITALSRHLDDDLTVVIVCPYQHLVDQWVEDIRKFNIDPIIGYSTSPQKDWLKRLDRAARDKRFKVKDSKFICLVCTNGTYATSKVQRLLDRIPGRKLIVADEAHNVGAEHMSKLLRDDFEYRLALSATIERYRDETGTRRIFEYFGDRCIEYTLEEAIYGRGDVEPCLTPYRYHPVIVYLDPDELERYGEISLEISRAMGTNPDGTPRISERAKMLALKRARLVAATRQKVPKLKEVIKAYKNDNYMLVYCGATKLEIGNHEEEGPDDYEMRQIDVVKRMLGNELDMKVRQFTARENSAERSEIKELFSRGDLQALVAIKCLDEGVNIPRIEKAFILASTTNPREYVQRRGRLLRKDKEGKKIRAEIFDFITLPRRPEAVVEGGWETPGEKRLVYNELVRAKEFADLAENAAQISKQLYEIEEAFFGLTGFEAFGNDAMEVI